ncbi:MAG: hypothetical protein M1829_003030 [Trizodia sp. TS-e1964]|nr:MAG: hypothetical protein M1829_003030 [Trizodia sp. TS-e1964]
MHLPLFFLLVASLSLAQPPPSLQDERPLSQEAAPPFPPDLAHILPSTVDSPGGIESSVYQALASLSSDTYSPVWQLFGAVLILLPPGIRDRSNAYSHKYLSQVLAETQFRLVPLTKFTSPGLFEDVSVQVTTKFGKTTPLDVNGWYSQFLSGMGVEISQGKVQ